MGSGAVRVIFYILYFIITVIFIWLAVANRGQISISLSPLDYAIDLPLFFVMMIGLFLGVLALGPVQAWKRWRLAQALRKSEKKRAVLEAEIASLTAERDQLKSALRPADEAIEKAQETGSGLIDYKDEKAGST